MSEQEKILAAQGYAVKNDDDEVEIDLLQIGRIILGKIWYILLIGVVLASITFLITKFVISPEYESQTQLYIINRQNDGITTYNDIQSSTQLVKDYKVLVVSSPVLEKVISNLKLDMTIDELEKLVTVAIESDSRVLEITVTNHDPYLAKQIADSIADISAEQITKIMKIEGVNVIQYGQIASSPSSPHCTRDAVIAFLAGVVISAMAFVIAFLLDDTIKSSDDIEKYLGISTLALIPYSEEADDTVDESKNNRKTKKKKK